MFELDKMNHFLQVKEINNVLEVNTITSNYDIIFSQSQAKELLLINQYTLQEVGRIGSGTSIIENLIITFVDSVFINKYNYQEIFMELVEIFYYYKEALEQYCSDEEIINYLKCAYEGPCQGSLEWLKEAILDKIIDDILEGKDIMEEIAYAYWKE